MSHTILENCVGCGFCAGKCPTRAIAGNDNSIYYIDASLCINCGVCGIVCPTESVVDASGFRIRKIDPLQMPKARVEEVLCSACEYCIDICLFNCISLQPRADRSEFFKAAVVDENLCVGCKMCEKVCEKGSIKIRRSLEFATYQTSEMKN